MSLKVLVVDDEAMTRELLRIMLQRGGFVVVEAGGGEEALEKVESDKPDLIILDLMMPDIDGFTVCGRLRSNPETVNIPVMMLSARTDDETVKLALAIGANKYLRKPVSYKGLMEDVEAVLNTTRN